MKVASGLSKRLKYTDVRYLLASIVDIYDLWTNDRARKPGADHWNMDTRYYRPLMCDAVTDRWCEITKRDTAEFPFHHDFVAAAWVMFRKEDRARKDLLRQELIHFVS